MDKQRVTDNINSLLAGFAIGIQCSIATSPINCTKDDCEAFTSALLSIRHENQNIDNQLYDQFKDELQQLINDNLSSQSNIQCHDLLNHLLQNDNQLQRLFESAYQMAMEIKNKTSGAIFETPPYTPEDTPQNSFIGEGNTSTTDQTPPFATPEEDLSQNFVIAMPNINIPPYQTTQTVDQHSHNTPSMDPIEGDDLDYNTITYEAVIRAQISSERQTSREAQETPESFVVSGDSFGEPDTSIQAPNTGAVMTSFDEHEASI